MPSVLNLYSRDTSTRSVNARSPFAPSPDHSNSKSLPPPPSPPRSPPPHDSKPPASPPPQLEPPATPHTLQPQTARDARAALCASAERSFSRQHQTPQSTPPPNALKPTDDPPGILKSLPSRLLANSVSPHESKKVAPSANPRSPQSTPAPLSDSRESLPPPLRAPRA